MATLSFTIDNGVLTEIVEEMSYRHHYDQAKLPGETKNQFAKRMQIVDYRNMVHSRRARLAAEAAAASITPTNESDIQ